MQYIIFILKVPSGLDLDLLAVGSNCFPFIKVCIFSFVIGLGGWGLALGDLLSLPWYLLSGSFLSFLVSFCLKYLLSFFEDVEVVVEEVVEDTFLLEKEEIELTATFFLTGGTSSSSSSLECGEGTEGGGGGEEGGEEFKSSVSWSESTVGNGGTEKVFCFLDVVVVVVLEVVVVEEDEEGGEEEGKGLISSERSFLKAEVDSFSISLGIGIQSMKYGVVSRWIYLGQKENRLRGRLWISEAIEGEMKGLGGESLVLSMGDFASFLKDDLDLEVDGPSVSSGFRFLFGESVISFGIK